ncbi:MAG: hypothetical protein FWE11_02925 [Defluviitaleaceae bacterium]|nr:hypothetical protein [Defluviitaleaceae bacterium]
MPERVFSLLGELDFIVSNITAIIMILTLISLLIANLARYVQAKNYGIPLKMVHQASIPDSLDIWITLISVLGFGLVIPWIMLSIDLHITIVFAVVFVSCLFGVASTRATVGGVRKREGMEDQRIDLSWYFYVLLALFTAIAFIYLHFAMRRVGGDYYEVSGGFLWTVFTVVARIQQGLHIFLILTLLVVNMYRKIYGNQDLMTVSIDDQVYLIAMRHVSNYWILIPCSLDRAEERAALYLSRKAKRDIVDVIRFTKGKFIVRDISQIDDTKNILCREKHELVAVKE